MKVLFIHNYYGSSAPSGENQVFDTEKLLLQKAGYDVEEITRCSDEIRAQGHSGLIRGALATPYNPFMSRIISKKVDVFKPDVVHSHNTFPLISASFLSRIAGKAARVNTLHNYRLFCPAAIPLRGGTVCTKCIDQRSVLPALRHGCYRSSRLATVPVALNIALNRGLGTWKNHVDAFIVLSEFQRLRMLEAGLPGNLIHVKPNFYSGNPRVIPWSDRNNCVVFVGRLSPEKGVGGLVRAWLDWGGSAPDLRIIGDGVLRDDLERLASTSSAGKIRFLGQLSPAAAEEQIARSKLLVLPSECYEGFPMVLREAFAFGTPAAVSNIGPLPSIVEHGKNGLVFEPGSPSSLQETIRIALEDQEYLERLSGGSRRSFETLYSEDANLKMLISIYEQAIEVSQKRNLRYK